MLAVVVVLDGGGRGDAAAPNGHKEARSGVIYKLELSSEPTPSDSSFRHLTKTS